MDKTPWERKERPLSAKRHYVSLFGLPESQLRWFAELTPEQVEDVKRHFSAGLVGVDNYVYAVKADGELVCRRERKRPEFGA